MRYRNRIVAEHCWYSPVEMWWHTVTHGRESERKTGECSQYPFTLPRNMVYPALLPLMGTLRLPVVDWTDVPAYLNGLVLIAKRRKLVSAHVPSHFKRSLQQRERLLASVAGSSVPSVLNLNCQRIFKKPLLIGRRGCIQRALNGETVSSR